MRQIGAVKAESFGVMQGRLSPITRHGYQAFPVDTWAQEFRLAQERSLDHIEWVVDSHTLSSNPLLLKPSTIAAVSEETNVSVVSVCADCFMTQPLDAKTAASRDMFERLLVGMQEIRATHLILPCVDEASVLSAANLNRLYSSLEYALEQTQSTKVEICLEVDLHPEAVRELIENFPSNNLSVNYDIGNSASLGYDPKEEFDAYGDHISVLHVKDRLINGPSVPLGSGSADFSLIASLLISSDFKGVITMQSFRDKAGLAIFDHQREALEKLFTPVLGI